MGRQGRATRVAARETQIRRKAGRFCCSKFPQYFSKEIQEATQGKTLSTCPTSRSAHVFESSRHHPDLLSAPRVLASVQSRSDSWLKRRVYAVGLWDTSTFGTPHARSRSSRVPEQAS